jgi:hypothetical protein
LYTSSWWSDYYDEDLISRKQRGKLRILNSMTLINLLISWSHVLLSSTSLPVELECKVGKCRHIYIRSYQWFLAQGTKLCNQPSAILLHYDIINYFALFACCIVRRMKWINKLVWWIKFAQAIDPFHKWLPIKNSFMCI